jgi:hypothetical protein
MTGIGQAGVDIDVFEGFTFGPTVGTAFAAGDTRTADAVLSVGLELERFKRVRGPGDEACERRERGELERAFSRMPPEYLPLAATGLLWSSACPAPAVSWVPVWNSGMEATWYVRQQLLGVHIYADPLALGPFTIGASFIALPSLAVRREYEIGGGPDVVLHFRLRQSSHASDFEVFARGDFSVDHEGNAHAGGVIGARLLFDPFSN